MRIFEIQKLVYFQFVQIAQLDMTATRLLDWRFRRHLLNLICISVGPSWKQIVLIGKKCRNYLDNRRSTKYCFRKFGGFLLLNLNVVHLNS